MNTEFAAYEYANPPGKPISRYSMKDQLIQSPLFICGHPKSGTSLVMTMLDSHPELVVFPEEAHYFRRFLPRLSTISKDEVVRLSEQCLLHFLRWDSKEPHASQEGFADRDYSHIEYHEVLQAFRRLLDDLGCERNTILPSAILAYGEVLHQVTERTKYWVEKTPYNEAYAAEIYSMWTNAKCIHIVRDPRDNFASYQRKHPEWNVDQFAFSWLSSFQSGEDNQKRFGNNRYLLIRYEDLVGSVEDSIRTITEFLDIADDPSLRVPSRSGKPWGGNSMFGDKFSAISTQPSGRFKEVLPEHTIKRINFLLFPEITRLKYDLDYHVGLEQAVHRRFIRLKWWLRARMP